METLPLPQNRINIRNLFKRNILNQINIALFVAVIVIFAILVPIYKSISAPLISLRSTATANNGTGTTTLVINKPTGTVSGDVLLAQILVNNINTTVTAPSGWTTLVTTQSSSSTKEISYYLVAGSSEPSTYSWGFNVSQEATGGISSYIGVNNVNPIDVTSGKSNSSTATITFTQVTTNYDNDMLVAFAGISGITTVTPPSGFSENYDVNDNADGNGKTAESSQLNKDTAGLTTVGTGAEDSGANTNLAQIIALRADMATPTPTPTATATPTPTPTPTPSGIYLRSSATSDNGGGAGSLVINAPAGVASGDVLVAQIVVNNVNTIVTSPAGWTSIITTQTSTSAKEISYYLVAGSSEPSTYTWTFDTTQSATGGIGSYVHVDNVSPINISSGKYNSGTATVTFTQITTTIANDMVVALVGVSGNTTITPPAGFSENYDVNDSTAGVNGKTAESSQLIQAAAGLSSVGTGSEGSGSASNLAQLIALAPSGATPAPTPTPTAPPAPTATPTATPTPTPGAGITLRSTATAQNGTGSTTLTINAPAGVTLGDFLLAQVVVNNINTVVTAPSGWTLLNTAQSFSSLKQISYYKIAGSSEPISYSWTFNVSEEATGGIASYVGVDNSAPIDANSGKFNSSTATVTFTQVTTTFANDMLVGLVGVSGNTTVTPPSGFTEEYDLNDTTDVNSGKTAELSQVIQVGVGTSTVGTGLEDTLTASNVAQLVALKPAGAGTPTPTPTAAPTTTPTATPTATPTPGPIDFTKIHKVFVIVFESNGMGDIQGNSSAPYINSLFSQASYATQYFPAPGMPNVSEPEYIWMEAGDNLGIVDDHSPTFNSQSTTDHLVTYLNNAGVSWKSYQEDITGTDCPDQSSGLYLVRHNPSVYFTDVTSNSSYCISHERPYSELSEDLLTNTVAQYNFLTPNACDDMHNDCTGDPIHQGDVWLQNNLPAILNSQAYEDAGAVFITFDNDDSSMNNAIPMIVLSPLAKGAGYHNSIHYDHGSLLKTIEEIFAASPILRNAASTTDLSDLFNPPSTIPTPIPTATPVPGPAPASTSSGNSQAPSGCNDTAPASAPNLFEADTADTYLNLFFAKAGAPVNSYDINYGTTPDASQYSDSFAYSGSQWIINREVSSLAPATTYYFRVRAGNGCNAGPWSGTIKVKTIAKSAGILSQLANLVHFYIGSSVSAQKSVVKVIGTPNTTSFHVVNTIPPFPVVSTQPKFQISPTNVQVVKKPLFVPSIITNIGKSIFNFFAKLFRF